MMVNENNFLKISMVVLSILLLALISLFSVLIPKDNIIIANANEGVSPRSIIVDSSELKKFIF